MHIGDLDSQVEMRGAPTREACKRVEGLPRIAGANSDAVLGQTGAAHGEILMHVFVSAVADLCKRLECVAQTTVSDAYVEFIRLMWHLWTMCGLLLDS